MTKLKIPTTLFTGFFGVGKTTAIRSLLSRKPKNESWAILVNEFGEVAIDQTALNTVNEKNIIIREIPGGCMCCVVNVPMKVAIAEILRRGKPDRLLIEPTGIGHPSGILDELRNADLKDVVDVGAVICFVDPRFIGDPRIQEVEVFRDQVHFSHRRSRSALQSFTRKPHQPPACNLRRRTRRRRHARQVLVADLQ